jgi:hypothetical protein
MMAEGLTLPERQKAWAAAKAFLYSAIGAGQLFKTASLLRIFGGI